MTEEQQIEKRAKEAAKFAGEPLLEMAKVADFKGFKLVVWTDDSGHIPHFHIMSGKHLSNPDFDSCLKIQEAEFYPHGGKHIDTLSSSQLKDLLSFLSSEDPYAVSPQTIWQAILSEWNRNDNRIKVSLKLPIPDYRHATFPSSGFSH